MFCPGPEVSKFVPHLVPQLHFENQVVQGGTLRWLKGAQGAPRGSKMDLGGANVLPWPRGFQIGATLNASMTL